MPIIATKIIVGGLAAATALGSAVGGYVAKDDISDVAQMASNYIEIKIDRHSQDMAESVINDALNRRFSGQDTSI